MGCQATLRVRLGHSLAKQPPPPPPPPPCPVAAREALTADFHSLTAVQGDALVAAMDAVGPKPYVQKPAATDGVGADSAGARVWQCVRVRVVATARTMATTSSQSDASNGHPNGTYRTSYHPNVCACRRTAALRTCAACKRCESTCDPGFRAKSTV